MQEIETILRQLATNKYAKTAGLGALAATVASGSKQEVLKNAAAGAGVGLALTWLLEQVAEEVDSHSGSGNPVKQSDNI